MPQQIPKRAVRIASQRLQALSLRAAGLSYQRIAEALSVSKTRAWRIVAKALTELAEQCPEKTENIRTLHLLRLDRLRFALEPRKSDPRVVNVLLQIMERESKLLGLDRPVRTEISGPNGRPLQAERPAEVDVSKLTVEEQQTLRRLELKMQGFDLPALPAKAQ